MLALSRKKNEALVINNNIEITVLEVKGEQVKLGRKESEALYAGIYLDTKQFNVIDI